MIAATTHLRHTLPFLNVLSKSDLLGEEQLQAILEWSSDPMALHGALQEERPSPKVALDVEFLKALESVGVYRKLTPVSSQSMTGMEDLYSVVQDAFMGGEGLEADKG
jgi:hypothetical protein